MKAPELNKFDSSVKARTKPDNQLGWVFVDGRMYREVKRYRGYLCLGTEWEEVNPQTGEIFSEKLDPKSETC